MHSLHSSVSGFLFGLAAIPFLTGCGAKTAAPRNDAVSAPDFADVPEATADDADFVDAFPEIRVDPGREDIPSLPDLPAVDVPEPITDPGDPNSEPGPDPASDPGSDGEPMIDLPLDPAPDQPEDLDPCTYQDLCSDSGCHGLPVTCDQTNSCTDNTCDPAIGACSYRPLDGKACDDHNLCTTGDTCQDGRCIGKAVSCDDGNPCTLDSYHPSLGCSHAPMLPCPREWPARTTISTAPEMCAMGPDPARILRTTRLSARTSMPVLPEIIAWPGSASGPQWSATTAIPARPTTAIPCTDAGWTGTGSTAATTAIPAPMIPARAQRSVCTSRTRRRATTATGAPARTPA